MPIDPPEYAHKIAIDSLTETSQIYKGYDPQETKLQPIEEKQDETMRQPNKKEKNTGVQEKPNYQQIHQRNHTI